jgi:HEAT repeat protein
MEDAVSPLLEALRGQAEGRRKAVRALAALGAEAAPAVPALIELLSARDPALRSEAAEALGRIGKPAVGPLLAALKQEDEEQRRALVIALALVGPAAREAVPALTPLRQDPVLGPWVKRALQRIERRRWPVWPRLLLGVFLVIGATAGLLAWLLTRPLPLTPPRVGAVAGLATAGMGAALGLIVGAREGDGRRTLWLTVLLGVGGGTAGLMLGSLVAALVEPVVRALTR